MYIADRDNCRIRKVTVSTGIIATIAGSGTSGSYSGDNGPATSATLNYPWDVALDSSGDCLLCELGCYLSMTYFPIPYLGNIYIADNDNHRVRHVTVSTGIITTIAGTGTGGYSGDNGPATSATLSYPYGVALDSSGYLICKSLFPFWSNRFFLLPR